MTILIINSVYKTGSTGRIVYDTAECLKSKNYICYVAYGRGKTIKDSNIFKIGRLYNQYLEVLATRIFDRQGLFSKIPTKKLINFIKSTKPDLIHIHNLHGYYLNYEILVDYLTTNNIPIVWTLHDCWPITGHCAYFDYANCSKWKLECNKCPQKKSYPKSLIFDNSKGNFHKKKELFSKIDNLTLVTPSNWLRNIISLSFMQNKNVITINNGINLELFKPTEPNEIKRLNIPKKSKIILGVANIWDNRKGLKYFLDLSKMIDNDYIIVLVGLSDKQLKILPNNILGIKRTSSVAELAELYTLANVFVNPTLEDNFPTTNLEAMACGTPVITFDTGGSPECIKKNTGFVVKKGDTTDLLRKIITVCDNGKSIYKDTCIAHVRENFDKNIKIEEYINTYNSILGG